MVQCDGGNTIDSSLGIKKKSKAKSKSDDKPMYLNGSVLRKLNADHVIPLEVDEINYGYYYIEEKDYKSSKPIGRALEEVYENLIHIDKR